MQQMDTSHNGHGMPPRRNRRISAIVLVVALALAIALLPRVVHEATRAPASSASPALQGCLKALHRPCLTPRDVRAYYGIDALLRQGITGKGRTVAIIVSFGSP